MSISTADEYVPGIVYGNLQRFIQCRGITSDYKFDTIDKFSTILKSYEYIYILGKKDNYTVLILLIAPDSKYATKSPEFRKLLKPLVSKYTSGKTSSVLDIIIISELELTNHIVKAIGEEYKIKPTIHRIELLTYDILKIVIPDHILVPKHTIADKSEVEEYCAEFHTSTDNFPKIWASDKMAIWIGAKPGDVVRIDSTSETAGKSVKYRLCINSSSN